MSSVQENQYEPTSVSHPGETLKATIRAICMTQSELSKRMGRPLKTINEIIRGKTAITSDTALQLETVLGIPAGFWLERQHQYDESISRSREMDRLPDFATWTKRFPLREMNRLFEFPLRENTSEQIRELLAFFGVVTPKQWYQYWNALAVSYRQSKVYSAQKEAVSVWLRIGEIKAQNVRCANYSQTNFREALKEIRGLTREEPSIFEERMRKLCAESGVAHVLVPELPRIALSGATRWITPKKALIQQNLRYKTNDQFWFTFFHEAAHILLHSNEGLILDFEGNKDTSENEADGFAADFLIGQRDYKKFISEVSPTRKTVAAFAKSIGIAEGIIVGRLQHDKIIGFNQLNDLKSKFTWSHQNEE